MKILIIGNYGAGNIGDEMILLGLIKGLSERINMAEFVIMTADIAFTEKFLKEYFPDKVFHFVSRMPFGIRSFLKGILNGELIRTIKTYREINIAVIGGGGLFADDEFAFAALLWFWQILPLILFKKKFGFFGVGVGPLNKWFSRFFARLIFGKASYIYVRDKYSQELMRKLTGKDAEVCPDPVFLLEDSELCLVQSGSMGSCVTGFYSGRHPYIVLSMKPWKSLNEDMCEKIAFCLDKIIEEFGLNIIFIPFQEKVVRDSEIANKIFVHIKNKNNFFILPYTSDISKIYMTFKNANAVIAMRLHANFMAFLAGTPCFSLFYSQKNKALLEIAEIGAGSQEIGAGSQGFQREPAPIWVPIWINQFEADDFLIKFRDFWDKKEAHKITCQKVLFVVKQKISKGFSGFCTRLLQLPM